MLDIDLNRLAIFKVVVLTGSFSKAGIQLKMPKSKVSRQIAALESELKVPLIYRTTRSLQLTEAGRELYQKALPHLLDLEAALQNIGDDRLDAQGALKFTVPEDIGVEIMGGLCHEFQQLYPRIRLEMIIDNRPLDLVSEGVDLALRIGRIKDSSLTIRKVGQVKLGFFAGLSLFQKQNRPTKVEDLLSIPYLSFFGSEKQVIKLKGPKDSVSLKLNPSFTSNNLFVLKKMALLGNGFTTLPSYLVQNDVARGELVPLFRDYKVEEKPIQLLYPPQKNMPPRLRVLIDFMAKKMAEKLEV